VDYYNRVHEMLHILTSNYNRDNDDIEGFGQRWDSEDAYGSWDTTKLGGILERHDLNEVISKVHPLRIALLLIQQMLHFLLVHLHHKARQLIKQAASHTIYSTLTIFNASLYSGHSTARL
jgi:hypothetical protein